MSSPPQVPVRLQQMAPAGYLAQSDVTGNACDSWRRVLGSGDHKRLGFPVRDPQGQKKETETPDSDAGSMKARGKNVEEITPSHWLAVGPAAPDWVLFAQGHD